MDLLEKITNPKFKTLSQRKQTELIDCIKQIINAGVQYNINYEMFDLFNVKIDTAEKRNALTFLLDEQLNFTPIDFRFAPVIEQLGDPYTKETLSYREFKLLQEVVKTCKVVGRENIIKLSQSLKSFNDDGVNLSKMEEDSKMFAKEVEKYTNNYGNLCKKYEIIPEDIDVLIDTATNDFKNQNK